MNLSGPKVATLKILIIGELISMMEMLKSTHEEMRRAVEFLTKQLRGIRYGEIGTGLIDTIRVESYGQLLPINQLAWTAPQNGRILITPHDPQLVGSIDKVLKKEGFNSYVFSKTQVVVNIPPKSGEDKVKVVAQINKIAEEAKVSIRNIRKKVRQNTDKTDLKSVDKELQKLTDDIIAEIELLVKNKIQSL